MGVRGVPGAQGIVCGNAKCTWNLVTPWHAICLEGMAHLVPVCVHM